MLHASRSVVCLRTAAACPSGPWLSWTHTTRVCLPPLQGLCPGLHTSTPACQRHGRGLPVPAGHRAPVLSPPMFPPSLPLFAASRFLPTCSHSLAHHTCVLRHFQPGSLQLLPEQATRCKGVFQGALSFRTDALLTHLPQASSSDLACRSLLLGHQGGRFRAQILHLCMTFTLQGPTSLLISSCP